MKDHVSYKRLLPPATSQEPVGHAASYGPCARMGHGRAAAVLSGLARCPDESTFEGGQYLHNPVYTSQSTPYSPALALQGSVSYMSWTGADAAQSINVSMANIASPAGMLSYPLYSGNPGLPEIALTFDDGPSATYTAQILSILQSYGVQATFF